VGVFYAAKGRFDVLRRGRRQEHNKRRGFFWVTHGGEKKRPARSTADREPIRGAVSFRKDSGGYSNPSSIARRYLRRVSGGSTGSTGGPLGIMKGVRGGATHQNGSATSTGGGNRHKACGIQQTVLYSVKAGVKQKSQTLGFLGLKLLNPLDSSR